MMKVILKNEDIKAEIDTFGGELVSLQDAGSGREYLWNGDPVFWNRRSPILFPFVGSTRNKEFTAKGQTCQMTQHGFARDQEFVLVDRSDTEAWFSLSSNTDTLKLFPYEFRLFLGYRLEGRELRVLWRVENPAEETLYFSIGGHPGFYCPMTGYQLQFDTASEVTSTTISDMGLATDKKVTYPLQDGRMDITEDLFAKDALVIEENQAHQVSLLKKGEEPYLTVTFDAPLFGIWAPYKKDVPFICIEPWYGRCDHEDFSGTLEERAWGNKLEAGGIWGASYTIYIA